MSAANWAASLSDLRRDGDRFVAEPVDNGHVRLFGGLVLAHALAAAADTVEPAFLPQSLHAYFVRGGTPGTSIDLDVVRLRDGRAFATRRVTASQAGKPILEMMGSFHLAESGEDWHPPAPPRVRPEEAPAVERMFDAEVFDVRTVAESSMFTGPPYWVRVREPVAADPITRACILAYMSDMGLMAAARPDAFGIDIGISVEEQRPLMRNAASLDHALWFHRPFDPNAWHCYEATKVNSNDARGLATGALYDAAGTLVASTAQEALWRV